MLSDITNFLVHPGKAFDGKKKISISQAFKYMLILSLVNPILTIIINMPLILYTPLITADEVIFTYFGFFLSVAFSYVVNIIFVSIVGIWFHGWVSLFGSRKGIYETLKATFYGFTPLYLFSWISLIDFTGFFLGYWNILVAIIINFWSLILIAFGIAKLHEIKMSKAVGAIALATIVGLIVIWFLSYTYWFRLF